MFEHLGLRASLLCAVHEQGYSVPTPVQAYAIPAILSGRNVSVSARAGSGKTAAFALPLLQRLMGVRRVDSEGIRAVIMVASGKCASQVAGHVRSLGVYLPFCCRTLSGRVGLKSRASASRVGVDIAVATPGCLLANAFAGTIELKDIEILVLDEVDRMIDRGFGHEIRELLSLMSVWRQIVLIGATFPCQVETLATRVVGEPNCFRPGQFTEPSLRSFSASAATISNSNPRVSPPRSPHHCGRLFVVKTVPVADATTRSARIPRRAASAPWTAYGHMGRFVHMQGGKRSRHAR